MHAMKVAVTYTLFLYEHWQKFFDNFFFQFVKSLGVDRSSEHYARTTSAAHCSEVDTASALHFFEAGYIRAIEIKFGMNICKYQTAI